MLPMAALISLLYLWTQLVVHQLSGSSLQHPIHTPALPLLGEKCSVFIVSRSWKAI